MTNPEHSSKSYWDLLHTAERLLAEGDFPGAEQHFEVACVRREDSPGRVFLTEKISDGLGRFFKRGASNESENPGRWARHREEFRLAFLSEGDNTVRRAVHLAELRPEDDALTNQPILQQALYLVGRSNIFAEEPASAIPLLKGLFRTAKRTGNPFPVNLVRHDLPLTEEDRLWLARRGGELVVEFQEQGSMTKGSAQAEEWARVCLQLLNPRYFGQTGRLEEERCWVEAMTADHLLGRAGESVAAYRKYLEGYPVPGERADEARIRLLELLANIDGLHFQVPNYDEALAAMQSAGLSPASAMAGRFEAALARIEHRRPDPEPGMTNNPAWASLALESDGRVAAVFWWGDQPRDVAYWRPGEDPRHIHDFLEPCEGRLISARQSTSAILNGVWEGFSGVWTVRDFVSALMEISLPAEGLDPESLLRIGMGETASWRNGWNPDHGHIHLEPPRQSTLAEAWLGGPAGASLISGLLMLAIRTRLATADPCLRGGIRQLARRGDPASLFLYEFLTVGSQVSAEVDSTFEPWTLPLLWTRPDPFGWSSQGAAQAESANPARDTLARPDLGRNDLAIVSTGDPAAVVAAWGDGRQKWRIVLDRLDRLESLSRVAGGAIGPVTLIPHSGKVHKLEMALEILEQMLTPEQRPGGSVTGLLPLFHWVRLVETHNGDLLDFLQVRPRLHTETPLYDEYQVLVAELPRAEPVLNTSSQQDNWATQFSQRVRKAGFVAGMVDSLVPDAARLDSLWGVFEGSDASWVFLDSASVHWSLLGRESAGIQELHTLLHSRGHRHLSLLTGAIWLRPELEELLGTWLGVFGTAYCVGLTDGRPPRLRLADRGLVPDSHFDPVLALAGQLSHVRQILSGNEGGTILLPGEGYCARFWQNVASGELLLAGDQWHFLRPARHNETGLLNGPVAASVLEIPDSRRHTLLVPVLASLEEGEAPIALADSPEDWEAADRNRHSFLEWRRKLCGLEIASLMAGTWQNIEIMDPRWWRLLRPENEGTGKPWSGAMAGALVSPEGVTTFDLPGLGDNKNDLLPTAINESVSQWFKSLPADGPLATGVPASVTNFPLPDSASRLLVGNPVALWSEITGFIARQWERGDLSAWVLLVADQLPGPAADMISASWTPGISVWPVNANPGLPGPVLWVNVDDFSNPAFVDYLAEHPPTMAMACGIETWLPGLNDKSQIGAFALRTLLDCPNTALVLQAQELAAPWIEFLQAATGVDYVQGAPGPDAENHSAEIPVFSGSSESLQQLRQLLTRLELVLPAKDDTRGDNSQAVVSARQLVSTRWLSCLAGVSEESIGQGMRILQWAGRIQGDSLSSASGQMEVSVNRPVTHALLIPQRFAELEHLLLRLENQLPVLFPLLLGNHRPGLSTWIDWAYPPVESDAQDLLLLDCYLFMVAGGTVADLKFKAPKGGMHSSRRLLACRGSASEVLGQLVEALSLFRGRVKDVMSGAVETGNGYLVDTGLSHLRSDERDFLATGAAMGLWRWLGPVDDESLHLVDLLTLAESPTVRLRESAWLLLEQLSTGTAVQQSASLTVNTADIQEDTSGGWGLGGLRNLLPGNAREGDFTQAVQKISGLVSPDGKSGLLVIKGAMGSGRHEAIMGALSATVAGLEVTVYCPDVEAAVVILEAAGPLGARFLGDIRIAEQGITPTAPRQFDGYLADTPNSLVIMCEVQRFEKETRYRIAQMGRGRKLLMTIDPVANFEPWENLFLTTPGAQQFIELQEPRRPARKLWEGVNYLLPDSAQISGQTLRQDKGSVIADFAVNLDQCLARLILDVESRDIPDRLRLVGPLLSDLDFLAESIRERGWLAIPEKVLATLLLPGVRQLLAVATDLIARGIAQEETLNIESDNPEEIPAAAPTEVLSDAILLTPHLLPGESVDQWRQWFNTCDLDLSTLSLAQFFAIIETQDWARSFLAHSASLERVLKLLDNWADERVVVLAGTALWEAWWLTTVAHLGLPVPDERRPLVTLAESSNPAGIFAPGGLYLCMGTENWRQHYNVLARVTDQALILYKDQSPLGSEGSGPS